MSGELKWGSLSRAAWRSVRKHLRGRLRCVRAPGAGQAVLCGQALRSSLEPMPRRIDRPVSSNGQGADRIPRVRSLTNAVLTKMPESQDKRGSFAIARLCCRHSRRRVRVSRGNPAESGSARPLWADSPSWPEKLAMWPSCRVITIRWVDASPC